MTTDPVADDRYPEIVAYDPELDGDFDTTEAAPEYESDPSATGTSRRAAPPDGRERDWTAIHPRGSEEVTRDDSA